MNFEKLSPLVPSLITPGESLAATLTPLHEALNQMSIAAGRLTFGASASSQPIPHAVLLSDLAALRMPVAAALVALSGSGTQYNGMYAGVDCSIPTDATNAIAGESNGPGPVGQQVAICLRLLSTPYGSLRPGLITAVSKHLSQILLANPILMHPAFLVPISASGRTEYVGVAAALTTSRQGGLPRYSHFHTEEPSGPPESRADQPLVKSLMAFARHPCTRFALTGKGMRVVSEETESTHALPIIKRESLVRALARALHPHTQFLGSVMELEELAFPRFRDADAVLPFWADAAHAEQWNEQLIAQMATSTAAAGGTLHSSVAEGINGWMPTYIPDPWFLAGVRARIQSLAPKGLNSTSRFVKNLADNMQRRLFLNNGAGLSLDLLRDNMHAMASALIQCGLADAPESATSFIVRNCLGDGRPDGNLPRVDTTGALAFLDVLDQMGHFGPNDGSTDLAAVRALQAAITADPNRQRPYRSEWLTALDAMIAEKTMTAIFNAAPPAPAATKEQATAAPALSSPTRRHRATL